MSITNSYEIIKSVMIALFTAEERRLATRVDRLVEDNRMFFQTTPHDGFHYHGKVYDPSDLMRGGKKTRVMLSPNMVDRMEEFLRDRTQIESDRKLISQVLFPLIQPCCDQQDLRDTLPNSIVDCLPSLRALSREREVAFTLAENPRLHGQFMKILPKLDYYAAMRLLY